MNIKYAEAIFDRDQATPFLGAMRMTGIRERVAAIIRDAAKSAKDDGGEINGDEIAGEVADLLCEALEDACIPDAPPLSSGTSDSIGMEMERLLFLPGEILAIVRLEDLRSLISSANVVAESAAP